MHYFNGQWVEEKDLLIPVKDLSVIRGFGIFDYLRTYNHKPFKLQAHVTRFYDSAKILGLSIPITEQEIIDAVSKGLELNKQPELGIRMILTGGNAGDYITPGEPSVIIYFYEVKDHPQTDFDNGASVITVPYKRDLPEAKSLNYFVGVLAHLEAEKTGAVEAIYIDSVTRRFYEGTTTNVFFVKDKTVITPKNEILRGITRHVIVSMCHDLNIELEERDVFMDELSEFDEVFISASNKEVLPIVKVDDRIIGNGNVGEISKLLESEYKKIIKKETS